jgi:hypothetical protein
MRVLIDNTYLVPLDVIERIKRVKCINGKWGSEARYVIEGEVDTAHLITDSQITTGPEMVAKKEVDAIANAVEGV